MKQLLNEERWETKDGINGTYLVDRPTKEGFERLSLNAYDARRESVFLDIVTNPNSKRYRGDFAKFCWEHKIGIDFAPSKRNVKLYGTKVNVGFAEWIGDDSHYDYDHFFYVTDLKGFEGKKVAFQLRVSNHVVDHSVWDDKHVEGKIDRNETKEPLNVNFALNFIINPMGRPADAALTNKAKSFVSSIECDISDYYRGMSTERKALIDNFVDRVESGEKVVISYNDILKMDINSESEQHIVKLVKDGNLPKTYLGWKRDPSQQYTMIRKSGPSKLADDDINFTERNPLKIKPRTTTGFVVTANGDGIPYSVIKTRDKNDIFEFNGVPYRLFIKNGGTEACAIRLRRSGRDREGNTTYAPIPGESPTNFIYDNVPDKIPFPSEMDLETNVFEYGGFKYVLVEKDGTCYAIPLVIDRNNNQVQLQNAISRVDENTRKMHITESDIMNMVKKVLREIRNIF